MTTSNVRNVSQAKGNSKAQKTERAVQITVKRGDTVSALARKYGMKPDEFKQWVGLKSNNVQLGQKITLPNDVVPEGKGIMALARKYNMSLDEFGKLNNLPKPYKDYVASKGEKFYVKKKVGEAPDAKPAASTVAKPAAKPAQAKPKPAAPKTQAKPKTAPKAKADPNNAAAAGAAIGAAVGTVVSNKAKWDSVYTPQELANKIYEGSKKNAAVGKPDFDALIDEINPKNVEEVLKAYTKKESLINTITSEVMSSKQAREDAVMKVYDALAKAKGTPAKARTEFQTELHAQLHKLFGMADTKNLDATIDKMVKMKDVVPAASLVHLRKNTNDRFNDKTKVTVKKTNKKTNVTVTKTFVSGELARGAISAAKDEGLRKFKEYCDANNIKFDKKKLDLTPMERIPGPTIKNGVMVMDESGLLKPTGKPNGKVIILNSGHGGYSSRSGCFDPGSYSFIKKANGKYAPLLEYEKATIYMESLTAKLRAQGYAVVMTAGHNETMGDRQSMTNLVKGLNNGTKGGQKYNKKDIMMISLHADSSPGAKGSAVCLQPGTADDEKLKNILMKDLNQDNWITAREEKRVWGTNGVGILNQTKDIPSVLLEIEYVNGGRSQNLDSSAYQTRFEVKVLNGINEYFKTK